ncbi:MAG: caspase family protein [Saprospiraceae bacterium]
MINYSLYKNSFTNLSLIFVLLISLSSSINMTSQCISGNCTNGKGTFIFPSGGKYSGNFINGMLNGNGVFYYTNGNIYTGEWKNNIREGKGKLDMPTGDEYYGDFRANKFWGTGTYRFSNKEEYSGEWYNDKAIGKGTYSFPNGESYIGSFDNGKFSGYGKYNYVDNSYYEGYWKDNKRVGQGKLIDKYGNNKSGTWDNDKLIKEDILLNEVSLDKEIDNLDFNRNCIEEYCKSGVGNYIFRDGSKWEGEFKDGRPFGKGTCYYADKRRYEGEWKRNVPEGYGIMYMPDGNIFGGKWKNGILVRQDNLSIEKEEKKETEIITVDTDPKVDIWALVIGVGAYNHMPVLKYTDDDAYQLYAFLKSPEGGLLPNDHIKLLIDENASQKNILDALEYITNKADANDVVMVYYAGHGLEGAFVPYDFDGTDKNLLYHNDILKIIDASRAKHKVIIADACHAGSLIAQRSPFSSMLEEYYLDFEKSHGGTALIMSSKEDENSMEYAGMRQGIFSHFLLLGLEGEADFDKNKIVNISELFDYVSTNVRKYTNNAQNPVISGDYDPEMPLSIVR